MQTRYTTNPTDFKHYDTDRIRREFLIESLFQPDSFELVYSHYDRMIVGGIMPVQGPQTLPTYDELKADIFLQRRELGIINIGGDGTVTVDGQVFELAKKDCLYVGLGSQEVVFASLQADQPARFALLSTPAHRTCPTAKLTSADASPNDLGAQETANQRTIYKYIHADGLQSCQLVMGLTTLKPGSIWNTMPPHVHDRRMEAYIYFDLADNQRVFHLMGHPQETRHLLVGNEQAILSPPWSIHAGAGTSHYSFIWAMAGENYTFTDMDFVPLGEIR
ncbi:4-deoxy-L-threo-5-hexosulose-uronate ketol-isomerase [Larkinella arboricola]|uniref:4-deoxy-L-threo-5-hexosulose-uronate ketol-isomerase n=1 Tax=Larkinella arboricola TaxID=643671 RepID=A0A327WYB5_LARAB|nr:5-dehydro-4-deoxy-D-glucuronate isomerase [Larkinella arboricola]RAJ97530.1 4-deoxy-L-threo-5-hexosulose-uronate ketol-isomerase [Larkinella arboricola]